MTSDPTSNCYCKSESPKTELRITILVTATEKMKVKNFYCETLIRASKVDSTFLSRKADDVCRTGLGKGWRRRKGAVPLKCAVYFVSVLQKHFDEEL